jgi:hypothetical protein
MMMYVVLGMVRLVTVVVGLTSHNHGHSRVVEIGGAGGGGPPSGGNQYYTAEVAHRLPTLAGRPLAPSPVSA